MIKLCPDPVDVQDLQFKLQCRLKVFDNKDIETFPHSHSLISCASRYALLFIGTNSTNLQVVQLKCVENYSPKDKDIANYPRRNHNLPAKPTHLSVNCDSTVLAVVVEKDNCPTVLFYDVLSFLKQTVALIREVRLSPTPNTKVLEVSWNPTIPGIFSACKNDGSLGVYELKDNSVDINEMPAASGACCFCWSPRGKQIAVGSRDGKITQYKPDLKAVKIVNAPALPSPHSLISLQWVSNFQFIGVYLSNEGQALVIVVDAPKTGETIYTNYEDICYSGSSRQHQFYMILQQQWNIVMVASSNATEVGVLGSVGDAWTQWIISDSARPELPLSETHQDTLPVGFAFDTSSTRPLPWGESTIHPAPLLLLLSHHGLLCVFNVINLKGGAPSLCNPPDSIQDLSGLQFFVAPVQPAVPSQQPAFAAAKPIIPNVPQPMFGIATNTTAPMPIFAAGQATITPIKPQQTTTQQAPPLFVGQTVITPVSKSLLPSTTAATPSITTAAKYSMFSALSAPTKPIATSAAPLQTQFGTATQSNKTVAPQSVPAKPPTALATPVVAKKVVATKNEQAETDAMLAQMVREDCISLESELKALLHQSRYMRINLGTDAEKSEMVHKIDALQEFLKEVVDISVGQNAEVHYLKQNLIQSWAWYEEARSRFNVSKDETMSILLRAQPLDSASEKHLKNIQHSMYYLQSQLVQASKALDEQWDNFQVYAKKTHRTEMPTMETIFQAMVRQNAIVQKQSYVLKDINSRMRSKKSSGPALLVSMDNAKEIEEELQRLRLEPQSICQMQYERILNRSKILSTNKTNKLRNLLKTREVFHVSAIKPQLSSSILQQSPASKSRHLISILGAQLSPVSKDVVAVKNLDFVQSTPKRDVKHVEFTKTPPNTPICTTATFLPFSKSSSTFPGNLLTSTPAANIPTQAFSAFVPTAQVATSASGAAFGNVKPKLSAFTSSTAALPVGAAKATPPASPFSGSPNIHTITTKPPSFFSTPPTVTIAGNLKLTAATTSFSFSAATTTSSNLISGAPKPLFSFGGTTTVFGAKTMESVSSTPKLASVAQTLASSTVKSTTPASSTAFSSLQFANVPKENDLKTTPSSTAQIVSKPSMFDAAASSVFANPSSDVTTTTPIIPSISHEKKPTDFGISSILSSAPTSGASATSIKPVVSVMPSVSAAAAAFGGATTTASSTKSIFGSVSSSVSPANPATSFFGTPASTTVATVSGIVPPTQSSIFSGFAQAGSMFGQAAPSTSAAITSTSIFGNSAGTHTSFFGTTTIASTTASPPMFGNSPATVFGTNTTTPTASTPPSMFGSTSTPSAFDNKTSTTTSSIFGAAPTPITTFAAAPLPVSTTTTSIFGNVASPPPAFGTTATSTTAPSIFATSTATTSSIFGSTATTPSSVFSPASTTASSGLFGGNKTTSMFGSSFGSTNTTASSPFGQQTTSVFGTPKSTATVFGTGQATFSTPSVFGAAPATTASAFGQQPTFGTATSSVFGTPTTTTASSFGSVPTSSAFGSGTSVFGTPTSSTASPFAVSSTAGGVFAPAPAASQPSSFSFAAAAGQTSTAGAFGFGSLNVAGGTATTSSGSIFGTSGGNFSPTTTANPFGKAVTNQKSIFGGSPTTTSPSIFGSNASSTFGAPVTAAPAFGSSAFGASSSFGQQPAFGQSTFGSAGAATGGSFGSAQPGPFSGGSTGVAQTGFGSAATFQKPSGFGAAPVFGGSPPPTFGSNPSFGGAPTFGAAPAFGSPPKMFGSAAPTSTFGGAVGQQSPSFGNLANQNTVGFGSLAQQQATNPANSSSFTANSSFSSWR